MQLDRHMDNNHCSEVFDTRYNTDTFIRSSLKNYGVGADLNWDWLNVSVRRTAESRVCVPRSAIAA